MQFVRERTWYCMIYAALNGISFILLTLLINLFEIDSHIILCESIKISRERVSQVNRKL